MTTANPTTLFQQQIDGNLVSIEQSGDILSLHFNNGLLQSQIDTSAADRLPLAGNRIMLAHLLFGETPGKVLLAGCGGGAIARWFNAMLPDSQGLAVESSAEIISLAKQYFEFPSSGSNWDIQQADVRSYLADQPERYDFILFDIEENRNTPDWLIQPEFVETCKHCLTDKGVISFNIVVRSAGDFSRALWPIRQVFPGKTYCLSSQDSQNIIITAFASKPSMVNLADRASKAKKRFQIEFDLFYQQLLKDNPPDSGIF